jgi:hypothetical protein
VSRGKQIGIILTGIFLFTLSWGLLILAKTLLKTNQNNNLNYLPENVSFAVRLDGRELAEKTLFSVFIESKDEQVLKMIQTLLKENTSEESEFRNLGIDYLSDILIFRISIENRQVSGMLFNVSNPGLFKKGLHDTPAAFACNEDVGVVLFDNSDRPIGSDRLNVYAERMLRKPTSTIAKLVIVHHQSGTFFEIYSNGSLFNDNGIIDRSDIHFGLNDHMLFINGKMKLNKSGSHKLNYLQRTLKPEGFHFSATQIPQALNDSLKRWLHSYDCKIPDIRSLSLNLRGTKIINHSSGFFVVPQMELYINTVSPINLIHVLSNTKLKSYFDYDLDSNWISFQDERLYFKQLSPSEIYIGITQNPHWKDHVAKELLVVRGNVKPLMKIEGGGLMTSFLEMIPEYRASKELCEHIDRLELTMRHSDRAQALLQGKIVFGENYHPMNEIIKFLLIGEFLDQ